MTVKARSEAIKIRPNPEAEISAKIITALTWPKTPAKAFLRPKFMPLLAANMTDGPMLIEARSEILK